MLSTSNSLTWFGQNIKYNEILNVNLCSQFHNIFPKYSVTWKTCFTLAHVCLPPRFANLFKRSAFQKTPRVSFLKFVLSMEEARMKDGLRCSTTHPGEHCVVLDGAWGKPTWSVECWDSRVLQTCYIMQHSVRELGGDSIWKVSPALDQRTAWLTVPSNLWNWTAVHIVIRMSESCAKIQVTAIIIIIITLTYIALFIRHLYQSALQYWYK